MMFTSQTGTDEHGQKIQEGPRRPGSPERVCGQCSRRGKRIWDLMNTSYDNFVRTTDEDHEKQVKKYLQKLYIKVTSTKVNMKGIILHTL